MVKVSSNKNPTKNNLTKPKVGLNLKNNAPVVALVKHYKKRADKSAKKILEADLAAMKTLDTTRAHRVLSEEEIAKIEVMAEFMPVDRIAHHFRMAKSTFFEIVKRQPELEIAYKKGQANFIYFLGCSLKQNIVDGKEASLIFALKSMAGYSEKPVPKPIDMSDIDLKLTSLNDINRLTISLIERGLSSGDITIDDLQKIINTLHTIKFTENVEHKLTLDSASRAEWLKKIELILEKVDNNGVGKDL